MQASLNSERQLRAVLESLKTQSPKQAMNLCDKFLKKSPSCPQLLAMKALLLMYLGKDTQGLQLAKEVAATKPTDLSTLGNVDKVFVIANDYKAAVGMFEEAFKASPLEDIGALWFFSVLRTQDSKSLFSIALKMHSMFKAARYLFWAILALHIQTKIPKTDKNSDLEYTEKSMKLAEKMILKVFSADKIGQRSLEELLLLIMTMQSTGNHQEALYVLRQARGISFPNGDERDILEADLLEKCGNAGEAVENAGSILKKRGIFDWAVWKLYVKAVEGSGEERQSLVAQIPELWQVIEPLTDRRSLLLAKVDAAIVFRDFFDSHQLTESILAYIYEFKEKDCCVPDTQHIAASLPEEALRSLFAHSSTKVSESSAEGGSLDDYLTWAVLERLFFAKLVQKECHGVDFDIDAKIQNAQARLCQVKVDGAANSVKASLAYMHLATLYIDKNSQTALISAAVCARKSLQLAPGDFSVKLLLILLYLRLGSISGALRIFHLLEIKQLQLDIITYLISDHILELGDLQHAGSFFQESFLIYDDNRTQSWPLIAEAFSRGTYSNVPEFFDFARRLEYSMQAVACICGTIRTELLTKSLDPMGQYLAEIRPEELFFDEAFMLNLNDNRDRDVIDFVDHSGNARRLLLDPLPTFGRGSIITYTFLALFFRALLFDDAAQFEKLHEKFSASMKEMPQAAVAGMNAGEAARLELINALISLAEKYIASDKNPEVFVSELSKLVVSAESRVETMVTPTYNVLSAWQWEVERDHWLCLSVAFLLRGVPSKSLRHVRVVTSDLVKMLTTKAAARQELLRKAAVDALQRPCPAREDNVEELWEELRFSWECSLNSYGEICQKSISALQEALNPERQRQPSAVVP